MIHCVGYYDDYNSEDDDDDGDDDDCDDDHDGDDDADDDDNYHNNDTYDQCCHHCHQSDYVSQQHTYLSFNFSTIGVTVVSYHCNYRCHIHCRL